MFSVFRSRANPLLAPRVDHVWENHATFNPSPVEHEGSRYIFYRAMARPDVMSAPDQGQSTIGLARLTPEGYGERQQVIAPKEDWDRYGCEDPRATFFEGTWYVFYTALGGIPFSADTIKVAVAYGDAPDRLTERRLVTPFNAKAAALFPERVEGDVVLMLTAHTDWTAEYPRPTIAFARAKNVEDFFDPAYWEAWHKDLESHAIPQVRRTDDDHIEVGAPPVLTDQGWLVIYSHIQHYYDEGSRLFGIEALLLDRDDLNKVIGRTTFPFLVPEEVYERFGILSDIVFPTGALLQGDTLEVFYGAADTCAASATLSLSQLLDAMRPGSLSEFAKRTSDKPMLSPIPDHPWEAKAVFNAAAIDLEGEVHLLYRAMGHDNTSTMGYARLPDGRTVAERLSDPVYVPRIAREQKNVQPDGNSGCEDPRLMLIEDTLYVAYTAYNGTEPPCGAVSSISPKDFVAKRFEWSEPTLLTAPDVGDKDVCFFPEKIDDKFVMIHRVEPNICIDFFDELPPRAPSRRCIELMATRRGMWDDRKIGAAGPPHRVPEGWLFIYHAVGSDGVYRLGAALLSEDASKVLARTAAPILVPELPWEKEGQVNQVVFSCGSVIRDTELLIYYGGGDTHIGLAIVSLPDLMTRLSPPV